MKKISSFLMMMVLFGAINAQSDFIWGDSFEYAAGSLLTDNGWTAHSTGANPITVSSGALEYLNYAPSGVGNKVTLTTSGEDVNHSFPANLTSGVVYAAFMVNFTSAQSVADYFVHFIGQSSSTLSGRVFAKSNGAGYQLGITKAAAAANAVYAEQILNFGTTYLVVIKYEIVAGTGNDLVSLFLNPAVGNPEPATPSAVAPDVTGTDPTYLAGFALRQGTAANAPALSLDGIRVATTWAEAVQVSGSTTPILSVSPTSLNFISPVGTTSTPQTVTISGTDLTGNITYTKTGADAAFFNITQSSWNPTTGGVLSVTFSPTIDKAYSASIVVSSPGASDQTVSLHGTTSVDLIWGEPFDYETGSLLSDNGWEAHSGGGTNAITVSSGALEYLNYVFSGVGNKVTLTTQGEDVNHPFPSNVTSGILYAAFMVNVNSAQTGDYFAHFIQNSSSFGGKVFAISNGAGYQLGITKAANAGTNVVYADQILDFGTTYLAVIKYEIVSGSTNDLVSLFLNPVVGNPEPATPSAVASDVSGADLSSVVGFALRQGANTQTPTLAVDGIRVATTWAEAVKYYSGTPTVATPTISPAGGNYINPVSVTLSCATEDAVIYYTTNGTDPTPSSLVYSTAIPVSTTTTIKAIAIKAGMDNSNIATAIYTFPVEVPNIAAFKAANPATSSVWYKITGDVTFVFRNTEGTGTNVNRYIYIKDATGGLLIYDYATSVITNTYNSGDLISGGVVGTCTVYNGLYELLPQENLATGTAGTPVEPMVVTMENLLDNFDFYQSQLVKLEEVTFDEGTFAAGTNINIYQDTEQMVCRNHFNTITGYETNSTSLYNVTGFAVPFNADRQIAPRDFDDIYEFEYTVTFLNWDNTLVSEKTDYHYGDPVVMPATNPTRPANNTWQFTFAGWNPEVEPIVYEDATYIATYDSAKVVYTITVVASPTAGGTVTGGGNFNYGDPATISATANPGYTFTTWNDGNTDATRTITVTETTTYTATFTPNTYTLFLDANGGTGAPASIPVIYDDVIGAGLVTPEYPGYDFNGWYIGSTLITANTVWKYTANQTAIASWSAATFTVTFTTAVGNVNPTTRDYVYNTTVTSLPTITPPAPAANYQFMGWYINGVPFTIGSTFLYTENQTAVARWSFAINITNNTPTWGTPASSTGMYLEGTDHSYTFTPNPNYHIASLILNGVQQVPNPDTEHSDPLTLDFNNLSEPKIVSVTFALNCYNHNFGTIGNGVTVSPNPNGDCVPHGTNLTYTLTTNCYDITGITVGGVPQTPPFNTISLGTIEGPLPEINITSEQRTYTITATPVSDPNGYITPTGTYNCGDNVTYEFNSTTLGYRASQLFVDGNPVTPVPLSGEYTFYNLQANHTIHVVFEEWTQYIVQFGPGQSQSAQMGGYVYANHKPDEENYVVVDSAYDYTFTIVPEQGYLIDKVYVDNVNVGAIATYTFTNVKKAHTIFATFKPVMFTIVSTSDANGSINPSGNVQVAYGSTPTFNTYPNAGYEFMRLLVDGEDVGTPSYTFPSVMENHTIHAMFKKVQYMITITSGDNGTTVPEDFVMVNHGANQTITFYPEEGYEVDKVFIDGNSTPSAATAGYYTFTNVISNHTIDVTFKIKMFTITATHAGGGHIQPSGIEYVEYWAHSSTFVFVPDAGYHVKQAIIDGINNPDAIAAGFYKFLNVTANHTIHVTFEPDGHIIVANASAGGSISPAGGVTVLNGENKTFMMKAFTDYELVRVMVDGINNELAVTNGYYTFFNVTAGHTITAEYERKNLNVYLPTEPGAIITPVDGSSSPVAFGGKFKFVVEPTEAYNQSTFTVYANNVVILPIGGIYTINNIVVDQYVTITGIDLNKYEILSKTNGGGMVTPLGITKVTHGESQSYTITPNKDYKISALEIDGASVGLVEVYTFTDVTGTHKIEAFFEYVKPVNIDDIDAATIEVFSHQNVVTILNTNLIPVQKVEIVDMYGRLIWEGSAVGEKTDITLNVATGIYNVRIVTDVTVTATKVSIVR